MSDYNEETGELYNFNDLDLGFANRPLKDENGFVRGQLIEISNKTFISKEKRTIKSLEDDKKELCDFINDLDQEEFGQLMDVLSSIMMD